MHRMTWPDQLEGPCLWGSQNQQGHAAMLLWRCRASNICRSGQPPPLPWPHCNRLFAAQIGLINHLHLHNAPRQQHWAEVILPAVAFSSLVRILGECLTVHSMSVLFFKMEISSRTLIPLFRPWSVCSGSVSWDDCGRMFPDKLCVSSFPDRFPRYACTVA